MYGDLVAFTGTFDAGWYQGRGAYGGLVGAVVLRAMIDAVGDAARTVRSFTIHFCAPATAVASEVRARVERKGFQVTHVSARLEQGAQTVCVATATFATTRSGESPRYSEAKRPDARAVEAFEGDSLDGVSGVPVFTQHFRFRFGVGHAPFSCAESSHLGGWVRLKEPSTLDAPGLLALVDAFPPAVLARFDRPRPSASVDFRVEFYTAFPVTGSDAEGWYLLELRSDVAADGYTNETIDLWSPEGALLARCHQLVAILG